MQKRNGHFLSIHQKGVVIERKVFDSKPGIPVFDFIGDAKGIPSAKAIGEKVGSTITAPVWTAPGGQDRDAIPLTGEIEGRVGV
jgi:hypothetical protein